MRIHFRNVGREKRSWTAELTSLSDRALYAEVKKGGELRSHDIDFNPDGTAATIYVGGFRAVGTLTVEGGARTFMKRYAELIARAEAALGPLTPGQRSDLLLDNCAEIPGSAEAHDILAALARDAASRPALPVLEIHDDWLINVLMSDGRFYTFNTELWPEHGEDGRSTNWAACKKEAYRLATALAAAEAPTWSIGDVGEELTPRQFSAASNLVCGRATDAEFRRYVRSYL